MPSDGKPGPVETHPLPLPPPALAAPHNTDLSAVRDDSAVNRVTGVLARAWATRPVRLVAWVVFAVVLFAGSVAPAHGQLNATIRQPEQISAPALSRNTTPCIASDHNGSWLAAWSYVALLDDGTPGDAARLDLVCRMRRAGRSDWGPRITLSRTHGIAANRRPAAAGDGHGVWVVVWESNRPADNPGGDETDLFYARSEDNGATWSDETRLTPVDDEHESGPGIATDGLGRWRIGWTAAAEGGEYSFAAFSESSDGGASWSEKAPWRTERRYDLRSLRFAANEAGDWGAAWIVRVRDGHDAKYDLVFARRLAGGNWGDPVLLDDHVTEPFMSPRLDTDGANTWVVAWLSSIDPAPGGPVYVYHARSRTNGRDWTAARRLNGLARASSVGGLGLTLRCDRAGRRSRWLAAWTQIAGPDGDLGEDGDVVASTADACAESWSLPAPLNTDAAGDPPQSHELSPGVAPGGDGTWYAIWSDDLQRPTSTGDISASAQVEVAPLILPDCNGNEVPDQDDLAAGTTDVRVVAAALSSTLPCPATDLCGFGLPGALFGCGLVLTLWTAGSAGRGRPRAQRRPTTQEAES